ncbi:MAG TPA: hypothetical protein VHI71_11920 [Actinomycetota bacterium]|nr:hypothetical protein [Actinomycetota bacterium]
MREAVEYWLGEDWERYALRLLHLHYPPGTIQDVPAKDRGDLGIDALSADGDVFQCYAAEEPLSVSELYAKQRNKMTADLRKLEENGVELLGLLGEKRVRRWIFLVPRFESRELIAHATRKTAELRAKALPHFADDFEILIQTASAFPDAVLRLREAAIADVQVAVPIPETDDIDAFAQQKPFLVATLEEKLRKLPGVDDDMAVAKVRNEMLIFYLRKLSIESSLWNRHPLFKGDVEEAIALAEHRLPLRYGPASGGANSAPATVADDLTNQLLGLLPGYRRSVAEDIAWGTVGDWLMRCPLDWSDTNG